MSIIVSASEGRRPAGQVGRFLRSAEQLECQARVELEAGETENAYLSAYRAALRLAGAWVQRTPVGRKTRKPSGAWAQLAQTGVAGQQWAASFQSWSQLNRRVSLGLVQGMEPDTVVALLELVERFAQAVLSGEEYAVEAVAA